MSHFVLFLDKFCIGISIGTKSDDLKARLDEIEIFLEIQRYSIAI